MGIIKKLIFTLAIIAIASPIYYWGSNQSLADSTAQVVPAINPMTGQPIMRSMMSAEQRKAAAARAAAARLKAVQPAGISLTAIPAFVPAPPGPGGTPDYFGTTPNYANSPIPTVAGTVITGGIRKFVDTLPGVGPANANNLGQYIPVAFANTTSFPGSDYYQLGLVEYSEKMHSDLPATRLRGYVDLNPVFGNQTSAHSRAHYLGPLIIAQKDRPVRIKFTNMLPTSDNPSSNLFIPVDTTAMGAGMGFNVFGDVSSIYTQNRATLHLHGGVTPWISDGTPHQWITPAGDPTPFKKGDSQQNVPDMFGGDPGDGMATFYWTNQQSSRMMFFHDHAYGITRLNVYAGEVAGYLITDPVEDRLD